MFSAVAWVFVALAGSALLVAMAMIGRSISFLTCDASSEVHADTTDEARHALEVRKDALLGELRDLAFEHDAGKLTDVDFNELNTAMRDEAKQLMAKLDRRGSAAWAQAESLVQAAMRTES